MARRVAVIDVGSNSLKVLVAEEKVGVLSAVAEMTEEVRLSPATDEPAEEISLRAQAAGLAAIGRLLAVARENGAEEIRLVGTSLLREAKNGTAFAAAVAAEWGVALKILSGENEARGIARGVATDPVLAGERALRIVDLGGGSLEYIASVEGQVTVAQSWPLGAVRMTRRFFPMAEKPLPAEAVRALAEETQKNVGGAITADGGKFAGCGGAFSVARAILAARAGKGFAEFSSVLAVAELRKLRDELAALPLVERTRIPGLPENRADILPAALTVLLAVAEAGQADGFVHSRRNLRYGLAADLLGDSP